MKLQIFMVLLRMYAGNSNERKEKTDEFSNLSYSVVVYDSQCG
jgi:hypothetical protein